MLVRAKKAQPLHKRQGGERPEPNRATPYSFPAPINGLVLDRNAATPMEASARVLDNWICTTTGVKPRGGYRLHATLDAAVSSVFTYSAGGTEKMFATTETDIFEVTAPADAEVTPTADVSGQTSGAYASAQFATSGGTYLYAVNGADSAQLYDGATWSSVTDVSTIAITGVTTSTLSHVWSHASRLFFVENGTFQAWYLPVDSIGGAATSFSLAGVFAKGGALLFGTTWSSDSGAGLDDRCVFVSTEGEAAVYQGVDPGSDFQLVGVYELPRPMGKNCHIKAGGDVLVATDVGLVPISAAAQNDIAALPARAVSRPISPLWQRQASALSGQSWEISKVSLDNIMLISQPTDQTALVVNLQSGAWSRWTGLDMRSVTEFRGIAYAGSDDGLVYILNVGGSDNGANYTARYLGNFDPIGAPGALKTVVQARSAVRAESPYRLSLTFKSDFDESPSPQPSSVAEYATDTWDSGLCDVASWDVEGQAIARASWNSIGATGSYLAPEVQMTFGVTPTPEVELISIEAMIEMGEIVV